MYLHSGVDVPADSECNAPKKNWMSSVTMINVHDSTLKKKRENEAKLCLKSPQDSWNNVFWPDETKMEMLGHNSQCYVQKPTGEYGQNQLIPVNDVRRGGGG